MKVGLVTGAAPREFGVVRARKLAANAKQSIGERRCGLFFVELGVFIRCDVAPNRFGDGRDDRFAIENGVQRQTQVAFGWRDPTLAESRRAIINATAIEHGVVRREDRNFRRNRYPRKLHEPMFGIEQSRKFEFMILGMLTGGRG